VALLIAAFLLLTSTAAWSEENEKLQPYIEKLKKTLPESSKPSASGDQPYIDSIKERLGPPAESSEGYTEKLKGSDPKKAEPAPNGYAEQQKNALEPKEPGGAIEAVKQGKSELEFKKKGRITAAGGIRVGVSNTYTFHGSSSATSGRFFDIYPDYWVPNVSVFGEIQPFHSEWFGNLGLTASAGFTSFKGRGKYANPNLFYTKPNGTTGASFGGTSQVGFRFNMIPLTAGVIYRFNLLRILRPYVSGSGVGIYYFENRDDGVDGHKGKSFGFQGSIGAALLLDFLSSQDSKDAYYGSGVYHTYFTVEYSRLKTTSGDVAFETSGVYSGITFEF
jgi:hypothetical protein